MKYDKKKNYDSYHYEGNFIGDMFHGQGKYCSKTSNYTYEGEFISGLPKSIHFAISDYPNELRIFISSNTKN